MKDLQAQLAALQSKLAERTAELEVANQALAASAPVERAQINGFLTIPKGGRQEWVGKTVECTVKVRAVFGRSKSGNVSARITSKVPVADLRVSDTPEKPAKSEEPRA